MILCLAGCNTLKCLKLLTLQLQTNRYVVLPYYDILEMKHVKLSEHSITFLSFNHITNLMML